jgi:mono/diheme cytochrome c family protein
VRDFWCSNFSKMKQSKYIISACLILLFITSGYYIVKIISDTPATANSPTLIDYEKETDNPDFVNIDGKIIYQSKCASCHNVFRETTGPALRAVLENSEWSNKARLYDYIRYPAKYSKDKYIKSSRKKYGVSHLGFPDLTDKEIDAIFRYLSYSQYKKGLPVA